MAPEGKFPVAAGPARAATSTSTAWKTLPAGVDTKEPLADVYGPEVLAALQAGPDTFTRWGITQGQGKLVGATLGELPVPAAVAAVTGGGSSRRPPPTRPRPSDRGPGDPEVARARMPAPPVDPAARPEPPRRRRPPAVARCAGARPGPGWR